jgi:TerC family integral membrane protein
MLGTPLHIWAIWAAVVSIALAIDLGIFKQRDQQPSLQVALIESAAWIVLSLGFNLWIYFSLGSRAGLEFLTGYLVEKSLSVDNIFIFILIFRALDVPPRSQHKVLFGGVIGALIFRAIFVYAGVELLQHIHALLYIFGVLLVLTGCRMLLPGERVVRPEKNWLVRLTKRILPVVEEPPSERFLVKRNGKWHGTHLLIALVAVEAMDLVFAVDSVPAVLAITHDIFVVYTSNVFAILGLRALYFALADLLPRFRFLHQGLAAILIFVGTKMLASERKPIPTHTSLGVIVVILAVTVAASLLFTRGLRDRS